MIKIGRGRERGSCCIPYKNYFKVNVIFKLILPKFALKLEIVMCAVNVLIT
jgi:hypothetical protein